MKKQKIQTIFKEWKKIQDQKICYNKPLEMTNNKADSSFIKINSKKILKLEKKISKLNLNDLNQKQLKELKKHAIREELKKEAKKRIK